MNEAPETLENIRNIMEEIGLVDGVAIADIVLEGPHSQACRVMLSDFQAGIQSLRQQDILNSESEKFLMVEIEENIEFFHNKYCSD